ncbi:MAG: BspA family leucine-rich repeat surface protein [Erysipelotrichaceae bacterium]|nr:BspA family leucine-rich repeat surface protein [Erysipelotrichaceae bacterium]
MKTKILKVLLSTAFIIHFVPTAVLAEEPWNKKSEPESFTDIWSMPADPILRGNAGVNWAIDSNKVLYFEAGELDNDIGWKSDYGRLIREIRVIPNEKYDKLILPEDCTGLFRNCRSLTKADTARFDTCQVTNMSSMFEGCTSLSHLDLSGFDTRQVSNMRSMFLNCSSLASLDVSSFDTSMIWDSDALDMLEGCTSLCKINFSKNFFQGDMTEAYPYEEETKWVLMDDCENIKDWQEMCNKGWNESDAGWRFLYSCHLEFHTGEAAEIPPLYEISGSRIDLSKFIPDKLHHDFTGWYLDPECTQKAEDPFILRSDTILYAGWKIHHPTITFDTECCWVIEPVTVEYGSKVYLNTMKPVNPGYTFCGWFTNPECTKEAPLLFRVYSDIDVYAKWIKN